MKKIRILEMESSKGWGGQEKRTVRLVNGLDKEAFEVFYAVQPDSRLYANREEIEATLLPLPMRQSYDIKAIISLCRMVGEHQINIISTHSGKDAWLGAVVGKIMRKPVVRVRHLQTPINSTTSYNMSTKVVAVSRQVASYLAKQGVKEKKLLTIYTGVDTEKYKPQKGILRDELKVDPGTKLVGIVAVLRAAKRHVDLIEAISRLDMDVKLVIVGDGPQKENITHFIKEKKMEDKVIMLGHREDVDKILPDLDIFVLPSNMEALGTSILEASACGVPCIGSRVGGIPECIIDGETGYLFENQNVEELQEKLHLLLSNDEQREVFGEHARALVLEAFSVKSMVEKTEALYRELV